MASSSGWGDDLLADSKGQKVTDFVFFLARAERSAVLMGFFFGLSSICSRSGGFDALVDRLRLNQGSGCSRGRLFEGNQCDGSCCCCGCSVDGCSGLFSLETTGVGSL